MKRVYLNIISVMIIMSLLLINNLSSEKALVSFSTNGSNASNSMTSNTDKLNDTTNVPNAMLENVSSTLATVKNTNQNTTSAITNLTKANQNTTSAITNLTKALENISNISGVIPVPATNATGVNAANIVEKILGSYLPHLFIIVIFLIIIIPLILDMHLAYRKKPKDSTDKENNRVEGMPGLYRSLMTFGVIVLVGTVIFYLLTLIMININNSTSTILQSLIDILKNLGTILGTALATIIAFYFGMRGSEDAAAKGAAVVLSGQTETTGVAPTIVGTSPIDGQKGVALTASIGAIFSKQMNSSTINTDTFTLKKDGETSIIPSEFTLYSDGKSVLLNPSSDLKPSTKYIATIAQGVKDVANNAMAADKVWSFETAGSATVEAAAGASPTIVRTYPNEDQKGIPVNTDIEVSFNKQMNSSTINSNTFTLKKNGEPSNIEGKITISSDGKIAILNPSSDLKLSTKYTITITKDVKDVAGNAMAADKVWSFETAPDGGGAVIQPPGGPGGGAVIQPP